MRDKTVILSLIIVCLLSTTPFVVKGEMDNTNFDGLLSRSNNPQLNFTYLDHDGTGAFGSTAFRVWDEDLVIFIEAFPNSTTCDWDPETITSADVIIQAPHGHGSHYDANEVAMVAKNTGAYLVGNSRLKSDMKSRGISDSQIYEVSPSAGGTASTNISSLGITIHAYGMDHTFMGGTQVDTFLVEMPSGITWYHGTCSSGSTTMSRMGNYPELKYTDVMIADTDMNFATLNSNYYPETLIKDHDFNSPSSPIPATVYEEYPKVLKQLNHNQTYNYIRPDYKPELALGNVNPNDGTTETLFDFSIIYSHRMESPPTRSQVIIDDVAHDLTTSQTSFRTGVTYKYQTNLTEGNHGFHFEFETEDGTTRFPTEGEIDKPTVNYRPILSSPMVDPIQGDDDMEYSYSVVYQDSDGDIPKAYSVFIDGDEESMDWTGNEYGSGVTFTYETTSLGVGNHTYYFVFTDGKETVRLPEISEFQGPGIERANYAPYLSSGIVDPTSGTRLHTFTFSVGYRDTHGDIPTRSQLILDDIPYDLTVEGNNYKTGVKYSVELGLDIGTHGYHFEFEEGPFSIRFPIGEEELKGPTVINLEPEADIDSLSEFEVFSVDDPVTLNGSTSTDPENDELQYNWTSDIDGFLGEGKEIEVFLSEGKHTIALEVKDGYGGTSHDEVQIVMVKYQTIFNLDVSLSPGSLPEGIDARVEVDVTNIGNKASGETEVTIFFDGEEVKSTDLNPIEPGFKGTVKFSFRTVGGNHTVKVVVNDDIVEWLNFTINPRSPPTASAEGVLEGKIGDLFTFDGSGSTSMGLIESYIWTIEDEILDGKVVQYTFNGSGTFNVSLTVTDDLGRSSTDTIKVMVIDPTTPEKESKDNEGSSSGNAGLFIFIFIGLLIVIALIVGGFFIMKKKREEATSAPPVPIPGSNTDPMTYQPQTPPITVSGNQNNGQTELIKEGPFF